MFHFGSIVLVRFPFTDLSGDKRRPALVVSQHNGRRIDIVVCFITSVPRTGSDIAKIEPTPETGLRAHSAVRFDKIATLSRDIVSGVLGKASPEWLSRYRQDFENLFGFSALPTDY